MSVNLLFNPAVYPKIVGQMLAETATRFRPNASGSMNAPEETRAAPISHQIPVLPGDKT